MKITVERSTEVQKAWGPRSVPKAHSNFLPNASELLCYQKRPVSAADCDHQSSAPVAFIFQEVRSVANHEGSTPLSSQWVRSSKVNTGEFQRHVTSNSSTCSPGF